MILKWRNLLSGTFIRNIVGLFVAFVLWGHHVQGRRTDDRAVLPRHTPYFSSKTNIFGVSSNPAHQWVDFISPASSDKRQKSDNVFATDATSSPPSQSPGEVQREKKEALSEISLNNENGDVEGTERSVEVQGDIVMGSKTFSGRNVLKNVENKLFAKSTVDFNASESTRSTVPSESVVVGNSDSSSVAPTETTVRFTQRSRVSILIPDDGVDAGYRNEQSLRDKHTEFSSDIRVTGSNGDVGRTRSSNSNSVINRKTNSAFVNSNAGVLNGESGKVIYPENVEFSTSENVIKQTYSSARVSQDDHELSMRPSDVDKNQRDYVTDVSTITNTNHRTKFIDSEVEVFYTVSSVASDVSSAGSSARDDGFETGSMSRRMGRQATAQEEGAEMIPACRKFVEGNPEKGEFYSPNFPNNYANNTDCIKVLAASPGHLLRLDFRDEFYIEPSDACKFDYLEVRDGAHGYENLIGTFCGKEFPPMMTSSGRFLWLRFHSDENIEYKGFSAVYESIPKPTSDIDHDLSDCVIDVGGSEGHIRTSDIEPERRRIVAHYSLKLECMWIIRVKPGWRIQLAFLKFELTKPNDCVSNFVDVFSDRTDLPSRLKSFCGSIADMVTSKSHVLHVRFVAEAKAINSSFEALFTAYRDAKVSACTRDEFDCQDETCISGELRCNNLVNCRFRWDEDECKAKISPLEKILSSDHIIIILIVFSLIMFGMCFAFVFNCVRKLMHDHKIIKENFRMSRENRLDEIGLKISSPHIITLDHDRSHSNSSSNVDLHHPLSSRNHQHHHSSNNHVDERRISNGEPHNVTQQTAGQECYVPGAGDLMPILIGATRHHSQTANGDAVFMRDNSDNSDNENIEDLEMSNFPLPEMRDNECQTRESLFMNTNSDRSITPPPPPPPTTQRHHNHQNRHQNVRAIGFSTFGYPADNRREVGVDSNDAPPSMKDYNTLPRHYHQNRDVSGQTAEHHGPPEPKDYATLPHHYHQHRDGGGHHQHGDPHGRGVKDPTHRGGYPTLPDAQRFRAEAVIEMEGGGKTAPGNESRPFSVDSTKSAPDVIVTH